MQGLRCHNSNFTMMLNQVTEWYFLQDLQAENTAIGVMVLIQQLFPAEDGEKMLQLMWRKNSNHILVLLFLSSV